MVDANVQNPPVEIKPAPWDLKAESYWLMLSLPAVLPENIYDPLEASFPEFADPKLAGEFKGGLGTIAIVRYFNTPCGKATLVPLCSANSP